MSLVYFKFIMLKYKLYREIPYLKQWPSKLIIIVYPYFLLEYF
jgi:hypothetical protein